jgi:ABC-type transporter Mla MlaB component
MQTMGSCRLELDGVFDMPAAQRVAEALSLVRPGGALHLDLRRVREIHDAGLAVLARSIESARDRVAVDVTGLRLHQLQLLRYLGVELGLPSLHHHQPVG